MTIKNLFMTALCLGWLVPSAAMAQGYKPTAHSKHWTGNAAPSQEITAQGTVRQVLTQRTAGAPAGVHLLLDTDQGALDASVGAKLSKEIQQNLTAGQAVQVVGVKRTASNGRSFVMVRELVVAEQHITIRNKHGFLVNTKSRAGSQRGQGSTIGGIQ